MQTIVVRSAPAVRARQRTVKRFRVMSKLAPTQVESRSPEILTFKMVKD